MTNCTWTWYISTPATNWSCNNRPSDRPFRTPTPKNCNRTRNAGAMTSTCTYDSCGTFAANSLTKTTTSDGKLRWSSLVVSSRGRTTNSRRSASPRKPRSGAFWGPETPSRNWRPKCRRDSAPKNGSLRIRTRRRNPDWRTSRTRRTYFPSDTGAVPRTGALFSLRRLDCSSSRCSNTKNTSFCKVYSAVFPERRRWCPVRRDCAPGARFHRRVIRPPSTESGGAWWGGRETGRSRRPLMFCPTGLYETGWTLLRTLNYSKKAMMINYNVTST